MYNFIIAVSYATYAMYPMLWTIQVFETLGRIAAWLTCFRIIDEIIKNKKWKIEDIEDREGEHVVLLPPADDQYASDE